MKHKRKLRNVFLYTAALVPLEPRLGKKLIEPLTTLIHSTSAMSLLYECINTVIAVLLTVSAEVPNRNAVCIIALQFVS